MKPEEFHGDSQLMLSVKFFDDIMTELAGDVMERYLCCSTCIRDDKERYFFDIGPGFVPRDSLERCQSFQSDSQDRLRPCALDEKHKSLMAQHTANHNQVKERVEQEQMEHAKKEKENEQNRQDQMERENREAKELERGDHKQKEQMQRVEEEKKKNRGDGWNYGMIIGNSEYDCPGLTDLPSIKEDRKLISNTLGNHDSYNVDFSNSEHPAIIDDYTNVEDIIGQVKDFMNEVRDKVTEGRGSGGEADTLLMFFLGHGGKVHGIDCILGVDGKPYPINSILHKILNKRCAKKVIMFLDCCRNNLDSDKFSLSKEEITNATKFTAFDKVIRIWSTQETHKATARSGATFSEALCEVLKENNEELKMKDVEQILNNHWGEKQKHQFKGKVKYKCKVDLDGDYESIFPC